MADSVFKGEASRTLCADTFLVYVEAIWRDWFTHCGAVQEETLETFDACAFGVVAFAVCVDLTADK